VRTAIRGLSASKPLTSKESVAHNHARSPTAIYRLIRNSRSTLCTNLQASWKKALRQLHRFWRMYCTHLMSMSVSKSLVYCSPSQLPAPPMLYGLGRYLKPKQRTLIPRHLSESIPRVKLTPDAKTTACLIPPLQPPRRPYPAAVLCLCSLPLLGRRDVFRMRSRSQQRARLSIYQLADSDRRESNGPPHLVRKSLNLNGLANLCGTNIRNVDVDTSSRFFDAVSTNRQSTAPIH
jgi:hypothetical protein